MLFKGLLEDRSHSLQEYNEAVEAARSKHLDFTPLVSLVYLCRLNYILIFCQIWLQANALREKTAIFLVLCSTEHLFALAEHN